MSAANWTDGQPVELARQFLALVGRSRSSLGPEAFLAYIKAITAASIYNVAESQPPSNQQQQQLQNIMHTATAIVVACKTFDPDRSERMEQQRAGEAKFDAATTAAVATALAPGAPTPKPLRKLQELVQQLLQQRSAAGGSTDTAHASANAAAAAAASGVSSSATGPPVLQVHRAVELYLEAIVDANLIAEEMMGDGLYESSFMGKVPFDGSAVAGSDLKEQATNLELNAHFRSLAPILAKYTRLLGSNIVEHVKQELDCSSIKRDPPHSSSSPLALFYTSAPVTMHTSASAAAAAAAAARKAAAAASNTAGSSSSSRAKRPRASNPSTSGSAAPDVLAAACCDVRVLEHIEAGYNVHIDGDLLSYSFSTGYKQRDPGLGAAAMRTGSSSSRRGDCSMDEAADNGGADGDGAAVGVGGHDSYRHGLFSCVRQVCSDAGNGLVWCAGDDSARVKAFRTPKSLGGPRNKNAACNRSDNRMELQYTFCTEGEGQHAGLHVSGTKVFAAMGSGTLLTWDIADLAPQPSWKVSERALGWEDAESDDDEDTYIGDLDLRDTDGIDLDDPECSKGTAAQAVLRLQRPSGTDSLTLHQTCLLAAAAGPPDTLAAACGLLYPETYVVITYDIETQRAKRLLFGHLGEVMDIAPAPAAWYGAQHMFATTARTGDVKNWDVRSSGGAAAVTLGACSDRGMRAVVLAACTSSSSSSSSELGAGMYCFAGGSNQSVWAWDLRGGQGQALYELSTGNLDVNALAWHECSSSLIASCDSSYEDRFGECYREEFHRVSDGFAGNEDEDLDDEEARWWPNKATHGAKDFPAYFAKTESAVLCYTFSSSASQKVPPPDQTYFD